MLVNPSDQRQADRAFQRYLDKQEASLQRRLAPILTAAINLQVTTSAMRAETYLLERAVPVLRDATIKIWRDMYVATDRSTAAVTRSANGVLVTKLLQDWGDEDDFYLPKFMERHLENITQYAVSKIKDIAESLMNHIRSRIFSGVQLGRSNADIARDIRIQAPQIARARAATIARTEIHNSALAAVEETLKYKKIRVRKKTWWTAQDTRVRATHAAVHGVTIPMEDKFTVGKSQMMRPGDPEGDAEEIINCRCSILYVTEEEMAPVPADAETMVGTRLSEAQILTSIEGLEEAQLIQFTNKDKTDFITALDGRDPAMFLNKMGYRGGAKVRVSGLPGRMVLQGYPEGGGAESEMVRSFQFAEGRKVITHVDHTLLEIDERAQGKGVAKRILKSQVALYQEMGIPAVHTHANIDVGGYAWAKYGFVPTEESWENLNLSFVPGLQDDDLAHAKKLVFSRDRKAIWAVADMERGVGKSMLLGSEWHGTLDLTDEVAMERFNGYVGK